MDDTPSNHCLIQVHSDRCMIYMIFMRFIISITDKISVNPYIGNHYKQVTIRGDAQNQTFDFAHVEEESNKLDIRRMQLYSQVLNYGLRITIIHVILRKYRRGKQCIKMIGCRHKVKL